MVLVLPAPPVGSCFGIAIWFTFFKASTSGYTYWRIAAQGWACDQNSSDAGSTAILGFVSTVFGFALMAGQALMVWGLHGAGLVVRNCTQRCEHEASACLDDCEREVREAQPASVSAYLRFALGVVAPCLQLLVAVCTVRLEQVGPKQPVWQPVLDEEELAVELGAP